jgi:hypothetical protein
MVVLVRRGDRGVASNVEVVRARHLPPVDGGDHEGQRLAPTEHGTTRLLALPETPNLPSVKRFAECNMSGTRQTDYLPSVTLGKERH